ncbi:MAG: MgtC/SapB family protein [Blastocatellia bacterium]
MDPNIPFQQLGIALGLGLLVGMQRESAASSRLAGVRTFPLITILGTVCALLAQSFGGLVIVAGFVALTGLIVVGRMGELKMGPADPGVTTETAMLLMFGVGAYLVSGNRIAAIAIGGGVAVLLQFKGQLHGIVGKLGENDLKAIMQFALISLVILPVLPNRAYGPYAVLNPRNIWWMVALIVGIGLSGYIVYKFFGERAGLVAGGILGGVISSTATTVSYARRTARSPESSRLAALVILISSTIVFARLLLEIGAVAPDFLPVAAPPLSLILVLLAAISGGLWFRKREDQILMPAQENPSELRSALFFGLLYALILLAVAYAKDRFGNRGLYVVAGLSGLTDVDAITLSTAQLVSLGRLGADDGWRLVLTAALSNLVFKAGVIVVLGHRALFKSVVAFYSLAVAAGILVLLLWPRAG